MKEKPYKASTDNELYDSLKSLNRFNIKPSHIETDGSIAIELSSAKGLENTTEAWIDEDGVILSDWGKSYEILISTETLIQLAAMSTCFAAGYAKARQEHEEKQTANA